MKPLTLDIPTIAVTGSAGKTTTKEMIASVLQVNLRIFKSKKTMNQRHHTRKHARLIEPDHQGVVLEFGLGRKNAGKVHCSYIQPNIGVITNVGTAHFGMLGNSIKSTVEYKSALIKYMKPDGILLINKDDKYSKYLNTKNFRGKIITVGFDDKADYQALDAKYLKKGMSFQVTVNNQVEKFFIPAFGHFNVINALFAIAIGNILNFEPDAIRTGLNQYRPPNHRFNIIKLRNQNYLIDDTYNSNPEAVKAAVDTLIKLGKRKKIIVVLGSMLELGRYSETGHMRIGRYLTRKKIDKICLLGNKSLYIKIGAEKLGNKNVKHFKSRVELHRWLLKNIEPSTYILVKGSNRTRMKETIHFLRKSLSK